MTGSPFSNVVGHNPGEDSTFKDVEATGDSDTTSETQTSTVDSGTEPAGGVTPGAVTHVAGEGETAGDQDPGQTTP
jgi:hypothetical protein